MNIFILVQACRGDDTDSGMMDEEELYEDSDKIKVKYLKRRREGIDSIPMSICSELDHARYGNNSSGQKGLHKPSFMEKIYPKYRQYGRGKGWSLGCQFVVIYKDPKNEYVIQEGGSSPVPPTPPVIMVVLLHKRTFVQSFVSN